jgi:alginate O-acetyltransferase complex protein AlgI
MIFSSFPYLLFFAVLLCLMAVIRSERLQKGFLLLASYFFYACWDYRFVLLLWLLSLVNFWVGREIEAQADPQRRKVWLIGGLSFDLAVLGFFKYFNFFVGSANAVLRPLHLALPLLAIILPVGISFVTFEVISYLVDIYRRTARSAHSFRDLALLVAFFPHLIAGPILKPIQFLPQLEAPIVIRRANIETGLQLFLLGLVKKLLCADRIALFVNTVFGAPGRFSATTLWLAVLAFAIQIYCDFSGYSDMAIGSAWCLGFTIPANFNLPYSAQNLTEFWRRWHISLSTWLKEYLYIPLGGNRKGKPRQYLNLLLVMLLGGLWHGARWNFVVWGGLHGAGLAAHKIYLDGLHKRDVLPGKLSQCLSWLVTLLFVCIAWIFFRAPDIPTASAILAKMFSLTDSAGIDWYQTSTLVALPIVFLCHYVGKTSGSRIRLRFDTFSGLFVLFFVLLGLFFLLPYASSPFLYFQF